MENIIKSLYYISNAHSVGANVITTGALALHMETILRYSNDKDNVYYRSAYATIINAGMAGKEWLDNRAKEMMGFIVE